MKNEIKPLDEKIRKMERELENTIFTCDKVRYDELQSKLKLFYQQEMIGGLKKKLETKECYRINICEIFSPDYRGCKNRYLIPVDLRKRKIYCPMFRIAKENKSDEIKQEEPVKNE